MIKRPILTVLFLLSFGELTQSQVSCLPESIIKAIQCETDEWNNEDIVFNTTLIYCKTIENNDTNSVDLVIVEFEKKGFVFDTTSCVTIENGKRIMRNEPKPIRLDNPLEVNNDIHARYKLLHFDKKDSLSCYYLWDDEFNPRGVKKEKDDCNQCYSEVKGIYCYLDTNDCLVEVNQGNDTFFRSGDTIQKEQIDRVNLCVIAADSNFELLFEKEKSHLKWTIAGENIQINKTGHNTFVVTVTTFRPNFVKLFFRIDEQDKLSFLSEETLYFYDLKEYVWTNMTIRSVYENTLPWIVIKTVENNNDIMKGESLSRFWLK